MAAGSRVILFTGSLFSFGSWYPLFLSKQHCGRNYDWMKFQPSLLLHLMKKARQKGKNTWRGLWIDIEYHYFFTQAATDAQDCSRIMLNVSFAILIQKAQIFCGARIRSVLQQMTFVWLREGSVRRRRKKDSLERVNRKWWNRADTL